MYTCIYFYKHVYFYVIFFAADGCKKEPRAFNAAGENRLQRSRTVR